MGLSLVKLIQQKCLGRLFTPDGNRIITIETPVISEAGGQYIERKMVVEITGEQIYLAKVSKRTQEILIEKKGKNYDRYLDFNKSRQ